MMLPPIVPRKTGGASSLLPLVPKSTAVSPTIVPRKLDGGAPMLPPLPRKGCADMSPYKKLSIPKPNTGWKGRKVTV
jgi:hypothetical protein